MKEKQSGERGYAENQRSKAASNGVYNKLAVLRQELISRGGFEVSVLDDRFSQDPSIWIQGFSSSVVIQVKMQLGGNKIVLNFRPNCSNPHSPKKAEKETLKTALRRTHYTTRNDGAYAPLADFKSATGFPGGIPLEDFAVIKRIIDAGIAAVSVDQQLG
jgi:hypothetical protein